MISENKKAVIWSGIDKASSFVVNFIIQLCLARLLCPADYAIVAMLAIFFAISQAFIDGGFPTALIQKQNCDQSLYSSVFYLNIGIGLLVYIIFYFGAPFIAEFYNQPNLKLVTRVYSLNLLIGSFSMVHRVILIKKLQFKKIATSSFCTSVISAIPALIMAYNGFGYWALITQYLFSSLLTCILLTHFSRWHPSFIFSFPDIKKIAPFGIKIMIVYIFHAIYNNIYSLLIGKRFTPNDLGYYDRGKTLSSLGAVGFSDFYTRALFPIQAKIQNNIEQLKQSYNKSFALSCYLIIPISAYLCIYSKSILYCILGPQWENAWQIVSILSIGYIFYPLQAININMIKVKGKGNLLLSSEVLKKGIGITLAILIIHFDFIYVIYGWTATIIIEFIISQIYCYRIDKLMFRITDLILPLIISYSFCFISRYAIGIFTDNFYLISIGGGLLFILLYLSVSIKKVKHLC